MPYQLNTDIIDNTKIADRIYKMEFLAPPISKIAMPGQFVHVRCTDGYKPLLRRPFSIQHIARSGKISIVYKVIGEGTTSLTKFRPQDNIDIIGPLGNHFLIPQDKRKIFIVAGGMGIAPLSFLIDFILEKKVKILDNIELVFGTKDAGQLILQDRFSHKKINLHLVTENGSLGKKATAIELFKGLVKKHSQLNCLVYGGGPIQMLKELNFICKSNNIPSQIAYENNMGCGLGVCLGCVIKTKSGPQRVCKDGPIFDIDEVIW